MRSLLRRLQTPGSGVLSPGAYRLLLPLNLGLVAWAAFQAFLTHDIQRTYCEYLVDFHFGFISRGLVPTVLGWGFPRISPLHFQVFALVLLAAVLGTYLAAFRREPLPLLAFAAASPCFFKHFAWDPGRLDVLGVIAAVAAAALPLRRWYWIAVVLSACALVVAHEGQLLLYVPPLLLIAALRLRARGDAFRWTHAAGLAAVLGTGVLVILFGRADVPEPVLWAHMQSRSTVPILRRTYLWYWGLGENLEMSLNPWLLDEQRRRLPVYALLLLLHLPIVLQLRRSAGSLPSGSRTGLRWGVLVVTLGYVGLSIVAIDRARWFANGTVCLVLLLHAVQRLSRAEVGKEPLRVLESRAAVAAAWVLTCCPHVGIMRPW